MPWYIFRCHTHGEFEEKQELHDMHVAYCPKCGLAAQRVYSAIGHYWDNPQPLFHEDGSYEEKY